MAQRYTWSRAPLGWWLWGPHQRKIAHIWMANGKAWGFKLYGSSKDIEAEPCGPWGTEEAAILELSQELIPKEDGK